MPFKGTRRKLCNRIVREDRVVKSLNIGEDICLGGVTGIVAIQVDRLAFQTAKEILSHGVVVRVP